MKIRTKKIVRANKERKRERMRRELKVLDSEIELLSKEIEEAGEK